MDITPQDQLETLFVLDAAGRIRSTREPQATPGPVFALIRSEESCAWAVRSDISAELADELSCLAREEPPLRGFRDPPLHADRYQALVAGQVNGGPAFTFPQTLPSSSGIVQVEDERLLLRHFTGWIPGEIAAGRAPAMAIFESEFPVSICFCARRSTSAAEAGVETAPGLRGKGFGPRVVAAWALALRASGRIPLYSTAWSNTASLALARKLSLVPYAVDWSISY